MKTTDLQTGMKVKLKSGKKCIVLKNIAVFNKLYDFILLQKNNLYRTSDLYNEDMTAIDDKNADIIEVYASDKGKINNKNYNYFFDLFNFDLSDFTLIYLRPKKGKWEYWPASPDDCESTVGRYWEEDEGVDIFK